MIKQLYQSLRNFLTRTPKYNSNHMLLSDVVKDCNERGGEVTPFPEEFARMVSDISRGNIGEGNCFVTASGLMFLLEPSIYTQTQ